MARFCHIASPPTTTTRTTLLVIVQHDFRLGAFIELVLFADCDPASYKLNRSDNHQRYRTSYLEFGSDFRRGVDVMVATEIRSGH